MKKTRNQIEAGPDEGAKEESTYWQHVAFGNKWREADTSVIDDLSSSWFRRRKTLQENSREYHEFVVRLKRRHAIETGIIENMYDLDKGVTETLIKEGFKEAYIGHLDTNIPTEDLVEHLNDHLEAVDFVFDVVKSSRPLTKGFMNELHHLVTLHQKTSEGRDQFGKKTKIPLLKGKFKERENNPVREDGVQFLYCPPEHVASEIDSLIEIFHTLSAEGVHPVIISAWFHHAFTTIHPYQDGNGRIARLLSSLILVKHGYFPLTVTREEAKTQYIDALEQADQGDPQPLVTYFSKVQKHYIEEALNLKEVSGTTYEEVAKVFSEKLGVWKHKQRKKHQELLDRNRQAIFNYCQTYLNEASLDLRGKVNNNAKVSLFSEPFEGEHQHWYYHQIVKYASKHDYYFNRALPKAWFVLKVDLAENRRYHLITTIHHYGYEDGTLAIGAFLEFKTSPADEEENTTLPLEIKPHVISVDAQIEERKQNIYQYLEDVLAVALAHIASEI